MGQVHAHRRGLAQDGEEGRLVIALEQFRPHSQGLVGRMADAEHPLIAAHRAHAAAHLVGQRLKAQAAVSGGQGAGDGLAGSLGGLDGQEDVDGFLETALEQVQVAFVGHLAAGCVGLERQMEAVNGVKEKQGPNPNVEVVAFAPQPVQSLALGQQVGQGRCPAVGVQRAVALGRIVGGDDAR